MIIEAVLLIILFVLIAILAFIFWIIMLVDVAQRKFKGESEKIIWILVIVLTGLIGSLIYYFVIHIKDREKTMKWFWWTLLGLVLFLIIAIVTFSNSLRPF